MSALVPRRSGGYATGTRALNRLTNQPVQQCVSVLHLICYAPRLIRYDSYTFDQTGVPRARQ